MDFIIPLRRLVVEVMGQQHYKFTPFFHKSLLEFNKSKERDAKKEEFCKLNNFIYIALSYKDTYEQWTEQLLRAYD